MLRPTEKKLLADVGTYSLVGAAVPAGILVKRKIAVTPVPQYQLVGNDVTLTYVRTLVAAAKSPPMVLVPPLDVKLLRQRKLAAAAVSAPYLLTGQAATLTYRREIDAATAGVYGPLAGQAATLRINMPMAATAGTYGPLAGQPATLRINMPFAAGVGAYALVAPATPVLLLRQRKLAAAVPICGVSAGWSGCRAAQAGAEYASGVPRRLSADARYNYQPATQAAADCRSEVAAVPADRPSRIDGDGQADDGNGEVAALRAGAAARCPA